MTFTGYLRKQQGRNDPVGDLAQDSQQDKSWPKGTNDYRAFRSHLSKYGSHVTDALREAYNEYLDLIDNHYD